MAIKPVELRVTFAQETWSSHEINKNNTKIKFLSADFIQKYPKYDVNNVRLPDIVGPTSYVWYNWSTSVKDERDRQLALRPKGRRKVGKWEYCADGRLSETGDPCFDSATIKAQETAAQERATKVSKFVQMNCHQISKPPILSEKEVMPILGQINGDDTETDNPSTSVDSAAAAPKPIRVGTDCSGMESPIQALEGMKMPFDHVFACDKDSDSKATIQANWKPAKFYDDIATRDNKMSPEVDLYTAGFPCQSFSRAGNREGFYDAKGNGTIFHHVHDYIVTNLPKVFILENVDNIVDIDNGKCLKVIMNALRSIVAPIGSELRKSMRAPLGYDRNCARLPIYEIH